MTFLEKFRADHPEAAMDDKSIIEGICPEDVGYTRPGTECGGLGPDGAGACRRCWEQEAPEGGTDDGV